MTDVLSSEEPRALQRAAAALADGAVIVIPTDTVYGVAVSPSVVGATARLFAAKRRPRDVTLPVLVADAGAVHAIAVVTPRAASLMARFWPGALTIVVPRLPDVELDLGTNDSTVGVRCPDHEFVRELCARAGPLAVTSANLHGEPTLPTAQEVASTLGGAVSLVVDGGRCEGEPSTVVEVSGDDVVLLREGRVRWDAITPYL